MKKISVWLMLLTFTALFAVSVTPALAHPETNPLEKPLYAGSPHYWGDEADPKYHTGWHEMHRMQVGSVYVWNDGENLNVTYVILPWLDWVMSETHLAVAGSFDDIPQTKKGNPKVGRFPYKHEELGGVTTDTYIIPLDDLEPVDDTLFIAAHAVVEIPGVREETAWADCGGKYAYFPGGNWATYFTYEVQ